MAKSAMVIREQIAICNADIRHYEFMSKEKPEVENYQRLFELRKAHLITLEEELAEAQKVEAE